MSSTDLGWTAPPPHVPAALVVDFDYFNPPRLQELGLQLALKELRDNNPRIFWTGRNGGHWVVTRAGEIEEVQTRYQDFSNTGISIPRSKMPSLPLESDPPLHTALRQVISPLFSPATLKTAEALAREMARSIADRLAPIGHCEFQNEFARHLPIAIFLHLVDLPLEDGPYLSNLAELRVRTADVAERDDAKKKTIDYLGDAIAARRKNPGQDFISRVITAKTEGRPLNEYELQNVLATLMFGGLDTTASALGYLLRFLALNPEARHWLRAQTSVPYNAVDELFRRHGVVSDARLVMADLSFHGIDMHAGEQILLPTALHGLDEERFDDPLSVRFDRSNAARHGTFGSGIHRCIGTNFARMEIKIVLEEWLKRIPDFGLIDEDPPVFAAGIAASVIKLPLKWSV